MEYPYNMKSTMYREDEVTQLEGQLNLDLVDISFKKRSSDTKEYEDVTNGDIWQFLHSIDKKLDLHLLAYNMQQPAITELIFNLNRWKHLKWAGLLLISAVTAVTATWAWIIDNLRKFLLPH